LPNEPKSVILCVDGKKNPDWADRTLRARQAVPQHGLSVVWGEGKKMICSIEEIDEVIEAHGGWPIE
jgi:hypothetical protein